MPIEFIPESMQRLCAPAARARRCESRSSITRIVLESAVVGILATVCVAWWQVWTVDLSAPPGSQFGARAGWTVATRTEGSCVSILSNATGPQAQQAAAVLLPSWSIANRAVDPADLGSFDPRLNDARLAVCPITPFPGLQFGKEYVEEARGWPMACLFSRYSTQRSVADNVGECMIFSVPLIEYGIDLHDRRSTSPNSPRHLPTRPIPVGFVVHAVMFGVLACPLLVCGGWVFRSIARARRAARGLCSYCGYPRVQSSPCSECGATHEPLGTQTFPFTPPK